MSSITERMGFSDKLRAVINGHTSWERSPRTEPQAEPQAGVDPFAGLSEIERTRLDYPNQVRLRDELAGDKKHSIWAEFRAQEVAESERMLSEGVEVTPGPSTPRGFPIDG